jgi:hypothetical protein
MCGKQFGKKDFLSFLTISRMVFTIPFTVWLKGTQDQDLFGFDFEICNISLLVKILRFSKKKFFYWASIGGGTIFPRSLKTMRNEKKIWARSKNILFFFIYVPFKWANTSFYKIWSINCARDGFICWSWAKMSIYILLTLRLSGIEFSLVSD